MLVAMQNSQLNLERTTSLPEKGLVTRLVGNLSLETVHNFLQTMRAERAPRLILDLSGVSFLDSAGIGALAQIYVHRRNQGQSLALAALTKQSQAVMQVAGLTKLIPTYRSVDEALAPQN